MRKIWKIALTAIAAHFVTPALAAYPERPIRVVVPWASGGSADTVARLVFAEASKVLGQPVIIDNRPGASGTIGSAEVARAAPDGYTLLFGTNSTYAIARHLNKTLSYDHISSFTPIALVAATPMVLAVHPSVKANNIRELIALAKNNPGKLNFGSAGIGATSHMAAELLSVAAGIRMTHVPYKSAAPALTGAISGDISLLFSDLSTVIPLINDSKLKAIGITSTKRNELLPNVPTISEDGLSSYNVYTINALFAPVRTPANIIDTISNALRSTLKKPDVIKALKSRGLELVDFNPNQVAEEIAKENDMWADVIKKQDIKLD